MRRPLTLALVLLSITAASCGGDGGGSPTAPPPPTLNVQGSWEGLWVAPVTVSMNLTQPPDSREVTGTISSLGFTFDIRGTTNFVSPGAGTFNWEVVGGGCGSWTGEMQVRGGNSMDGPSRLSTVGCADPDVLEGRMVLSRRGAALTYEPTEDPAGQPSIRELVRALGAER